MRSRFVFVLYGWYRISVPLPRVKRSVWRGREKVLAT